MKVSVEGIVLEVGLLLQQLRFSNEADRQLLELALSQQKTITITVWKP